MDVKPSLGSLMRRLVRAQPELGALWLKVPVCPGWALTPKVSLDPSCSRHDTKPDLTRAQNKQQKGFGPWAPDKSSIWQGPTPRVDLAPVPLNLAHGSNLGSGGREAKRAAQKQCQEIPEPFGD